MTKDTPTPAAAPIIVGVDGSEGSLTAVRYGAREAARAGCELHLVHVAPSYLPVAGLVPSAGTVSVKEFEGIGRTILKEAAVAAYEFLPRARVRTILRLGLRVPEVLDAARGGRLLVVGDDRTPVVARLIVGRFIGVLAAKSQIPVVSVPANWKQHDDAADHRVVLALKDPQRIPAGLLRAGFQAAADHDATLEITHVWNMPAGYGALVTSMMDDPSWQSTIERSVRRLVAPLRAEFPDVSYTTTSKYGQAAHILCEAGRGADLLLLSRRAHGFPLGHFGATGRALLRAATCPVEVLPIAERSAESTLPTHRAPTDEPADAMTRH